MDAMRITDRLAIWMQKSHIQDRRWLEKTCASYESPLVKKVALSTLETLWIHAGIWKYYVEFNHDTSSVESFFELHKDIDLTLAKNSLRLAQGERLRVVKSAKLNEAQLSKVFDELHYRTATIKSSKDDSYIQACIANKML